jgi:hypothetical protein
MAQNIPCAVCNQVTDAEWLVTNRTDEWDEDMPRTFGICQMCLVRTSLQLVGLDADALLSSQSEQPEGPGVLEQIEADEGEVKPAPSRTRSTKSRAQAGQPNGATAEQETAAADVDQ